ncbi:MAG: DUF11 domain-containing protein, partial [Methylococcales bacterium]|nr:DUF11 domain-containing protein [Methylococcales bacterium]
AAGTTEHQAFIEADQLYTAFGQPDRNLHDINPTCVESTLTVPPQTNVLEQLRVGFNATSSDRRLDVTLKSPNDAITLELTTGFANRRNYDVLFVDGGGVLGDGANHDVSRPFYENALAPDNGAGETFAKFNDLNPTGEWTLEICGYRSDRVTLLHHWTLLLDFSTIALEKEVAPLVVAPSGTLTYTLVVKNNVNLVQTGVVISDVISAENIFTPGSIQTIGAPAATFDAGLNAVIWDGDLAINETVTITFNTTVSTSLITHDRITNTVTLTNSATTATAISEAFADQDFLYTTAGLQPPLSIPIDQCNNFENSIIHVPDAFTIDSVRVGVNGLFFDPSDMQVHLISPTGTDIDLYNGNQNANAQNDYLLDDTASTNFGSASPAMPYYDRIAKPGGNLSDFVGEAAQGNWTLALCHDDINASTPSTLNHWSLFFDENNTPVLALEKTAQPTLVTVGDVISYTLTITNSGGGTAVSALLSDTLPANVTLVGGSLVADSAPAPTFDGTKVQWQGDVPPNNSSVTAEFAVTVGNSSDLITNTATLT